mgnify:CR=1 FL=1
MNASGMSNRGQQTISKVAATKQPRRAEKGKMSSYGRRGARSRGVEYSEANVPEGGAGRVPTRPSEAVEGLEKLAEFAEDTLQKQNLCVDILSNGFVQSYVDFFYLMHRPDPNPDPNRPELADAEIQVSAQDMLLIKDNLTKAESARRQGETNVVFEAYSDLARHFESVDDSKTGIYFYEKCLEIAKLTSDVVGEVRANHNLGLAHGRLKDADMAISFHEKEYELTQSHVDDAAVAETLAMEARTASFELVKAYQMKAERLEGDEKTLPEAISLYEKCLEAAKNTKHQKTIGTANFQLGRAHVSNNNAEGAIEFLQSYLDLCISMKDLEGQGAASAALAAAMQSLGNTDEAVKSLQKYLDIAKQTDNLKAQAEACCNLGVIYNRRKEFDKAVHFFERNFETTRSIVASGKSSRKLVDSARVNLGMARGNAQQNTYMNVINYDLSALLLWKTRRLNFGKA